MRLRDVIFSLCCLMVYPSGSVYGQASVQADSLRSDYERRMTKRMEKWQRLIPRHYKVQFAGSIGVASFGVGWTYGKKKQWETDLMLGFLPKYHSEDAKAILTLKESYTPWTCRVAQSDWVIQPFSCGLFLSSVLNENFWANEPGRYPKGYYGFSTRIRANLFLGQRLMWDCPEEALKWIQDVSLYYELSACDTDLCTFFGDRCIRFKDILSLSLGLKIHI